MKVRIPAIEMSWRSMAFLSTVDRHVLGLAVDADAPKEIKEFIMVC